MSDQDLASQLEQLRARQDQTDESLVVLANVIAELVEQVKADPLSGTMVSLNLAGADHVLRTIQQRHKSNRAG